MCHSCRPIPDVCADKVAGCKQCPKVCTSTYTTQPGDSCWSIANTAGITVEALLSLNPGVNCDTLQPNQQFCTAQGEGQCTNVCEGIQI
jgi:LysM repeat protein